MSSWAEAVCNWGRVAKGCCRGVLGFPSQPGIWVPSEPCPATILSETVKTGDKRPHFTIYRVSGLCSPRLGSRSGSEVNSRAVEG